MLLHRRTLTEWMLVTVVLVAVAGLTAWQGWLWRADHLLYDIGLSIGSRQVPADIVIVAIDEESLARMGRWPWRRAIHAMLLDKLTQAEVAAVGMDIILSEADAEDARGDRLLADAIRRNGRLVLPVVQRPLGPGLLTEGRPIKPFAKAAAGLGHIEMQLDADGIARSIYLWGGAGKASYPQLALALLQVADPGAAARYARASPRADDVAPGTGWNRDGWLHIRFAGPPGTYNTVSYVDVLSGAIGAEQLRGKLILVGATAAGLGDIYPTPMSGLGRSMAGVEIHATVLDALRTGAIIESLSAGGMMAITVVTIVALMFGLLHLSPRDGLLLSAAVGLAAIIGVILLLLWGRLWLPPSPILIGATLAYPLWSWRRLEAAQRFIDAELRQLHDIEPGATDNVPAERSIDPVENRIAIVRAAAERQRAIQKAREDTMRFISHDIRSPLASIITLVEAGGGRPGGDPRLHQVGRYAQNALDLADDFFRLAKAEAVDPRNFCEIDLSSLAQEAADEIWPLAERKHILILVRDVGSQDSIVLGDQSLLRRALTNLLGNAIKYSPDSTTVRVTLHDDADWVEIDVADEGCGITAEHLGKLFTRYGRIARPDQPDQSGVGLGLLIVKTIVERHGGTVSVTSSVGAGSTFTVRLPRVRPAGV
ncbi:MAG TPA: CHASE2 domain-containing protein [Rhodocyclaceae bacterium]|nr:CHASE2 domain-containing protein [Rhodocyclaceae bacterium]